MYIVHNLTSDIIAIYALSANKVITNILFETQKVPDTYINRLCILMFIIH